MEIAFASVAPQVHNFKLARCLQKRVEEEKESGTFVNSNFEQIVSCWISIAILAERCFILLNSHNFAEVSYEGEIERKSYSHNYFETIHAEKDNTPTHFNLHK